MRILLVGASGFIGGALWSSLSRRHEIVGTCASREVPGLVRLDVRDYAALAALAANSFDVVIHAAGLVDLGPAEKDPDLAWALNVHPVPVLLDALRGSATKLVYLSSDNVFDGTREVCTEQEPRSPVNVYGRSKLAAEDLVLADPRHLVVRIPIVFGRSPWADKFLARFAKPTTPAYSDVVCAPVYLPALAQALEQLWETYTGVVHFGGSDVVTRLDLMTRVRDALALPTRIVPIREEDTAAECRRPRRLVLRSVRHNLVGPSIDDALRDMAGM